MEGLDASILRVSEVADLNPGFRVDAEFFARPAMKALAGIRLAQHESLRNLCSRIQHPIEVVREYEDEGLLTVMAKNVRSNRVELSDLRFMPAELRPVVSRNQLCRDDILITRTGANFGQSATWKHDHEAFVCADILVLRKPSIPAGYLSSFLECSVGKPLVLRGGYGAGQPHIAPPYLEDMLIPRFGTLENRVDKVVERSVGLEQEATNTIMQAEQILLSALGIAEWTPPEPLAYTARAVDVFASGRFDARFYAPRIQALLDLLSSEGRKVVNVTNARREKFRPEDHAAFEYIEISDIDGTGAATSTRLASEDAPSRATWHVREGDIITSTVRPIRRLTAQIPPEQDGFVCSSGFVVLTPRGIAPEVLLTYLRLPVICELLDLYASASMYPAITDSDIFNLPLPHISDAVAVHVTQKVQAAKAAKARAAALLEAAKRAVEIAIENGEPAAITHLDRAEEMI